MPNFFKNPKTIIAIIIILAIAGAGYNYYSKPKITPYEFVLAQKKDIVQEVSITGNIKPAETINLAFETGGKINRVNAKIGDKVTAGQAIAGISDTNMRAQLDNAISQLGQYEAAYQSQLAKLNQMKSGTRPEEIRIAETTVANTQNSLADAKTNLENVKSKAIADIAQINDGAVNAAIKSVSVATNSIFVAMDIQTAHFSGNTEDANRITEAKSDAIFYLLDGHNVTNLSKDAIGQLNGGAKEKVLTAQSSPTDANISIALADLKIALQKTKTLLDAIPVTSVLTSTESTNLNTEKTNINNEIIGIAAKQTAIVVQKVTNQNAISTAQTAINTAENTLATAEDNLALKKAGNTQEEINAQDAQVRQALANINSQRTQIKQAEIKLAQTIIHSPINGTMIKQDAKIGQIVSPNITIASIMSEAQFQIEANVAETDIAKVKIGDPANITLDTYGNDIIFTAKIISIDPAETIIEGVSTYKTTLEFTKEDGQIKSGMTANIDIVTAKKEGVIAIPQRTIIAKDGQKFVLIGLLNNQQEERKIETGLRDSSGNIEIISGLSEGEKIVLPQVE